MRRQIRDSVEVSFMISDQVIIRPNFRAMDVHVSQLVGGFRRSFKKRLKSSGRILESSGPERRC